MTLRIVGPGLRHMICRAAFAVLGASVLVIALAGYRLMRIRGEVSDLRLGHSGRQARLAENRKVAVTVPKEPKPDALDRSRAVSKVRATLTALAAKKGFAIDEFQAATEEMPYLTSYAADSNDPGWMQVAVRLLLTGRSTVLASSLDSLRDLDVPFEIDHVELTRRSTDNSGKAVVAQQVQMRVLVYRGEG